MTKRTFYLIIFLALTGCGYISESQVIDKEQSQVLKEILRNKETGIGNELDTLENQVK